ncbi:MAG: FHA domain-containing protein [Eubacteriales bacterium]|nr:FHA domain-containing protein [Eubacteriales bacterium]
MTIAKCSNNHIYDSSIYSSCPYCMSNSGPEKPVEMTPPVRNDRDDGKTKFVERPKVVGWLVCTGGTMEGKSYNLYSKQNTVGRAPLSDVHIEGDSTISDKHCLIAYDERHNRFTLVPKTETNLMSLNGEYVRKATRLSSFDRIEMGKSSFLFVALCGDQFTWKPVKSAKPEENGGEKS